MGGSMSKNFLTQVLMLILFFLLACLIMLVSMSNLHVKLIDS